MSSNHSNFILRLVSVFFNIIIVSSSTNSESTKTKGACDLLCSGHSQNYPKYQQGSRYTYKYDATTGIRLTNDEDNYQSQVNLEGYATLTAITSCYFDLSVSHLKITNQFRSNIVNKIDIPNSSIRFHFENGTINRVCTASDDLPHSANVKRSMISLLQLTSHSTQESDFKVREEQNDVMGQCPTDIEKIDQVYYKSRNLNLCNRRFAGPSFSNGVPYDTTKERFKSVPLVDSKLKCKQEIYENVIQRSVCNEVNILVNPLSVMSEDQREDQEHRDDNFESNPKIISKSSLTLVHTIRSDFTPSQKPDFIQSTINFDFDQRSQKFQDQQTTSSLHTSTLNKILHLLCSDFQSDDLKDAPFHFLQLKDVFYQLSKQDLLQAYVKIAKENETCPIHREKLEKIFLKTAVKTCSIGFISSLLTSPNSHRDLLTELVQNLPFAKNPSQADLSELLKLIKYFTSGADENDDKRTISNQQLILSASAFAHQYCKITNPKCDTVKEFTDIVDFIAINSLQNCENQQDEAVDAAVVGLHALGNLEHLSPTAVSHVNKCLSSKLTRIKIHALNVLPCQPLLKNKAKALFGDLRVGSDVRIHGFLSILRCMELEDIPLIQRSLDNDQSNQVSSFIHSYIRNQLESSSHGKQALNSLLRKLHLDKEFPKSMGSFGQWSKNIELSQYSKRFGIGSSVESNWIYSQDSYLPRTTSFNFTVDLFGSSYNLFEVGMYLENYENLLSRFHSPLSSFKQSFNNEEPEHSEKETADYMEFYSSINELSDVNISSDASLRHTATDMSNEDLRESQNEILKLTNNGIIESRINPNDIKSIAEQVQIKDRYKDSGILDTFLKFHGVTVAVSSIRQKNFPALYDFEWLVKQYNEVVGSLKDAIVERIKPITSIDESIVIASNGLPINLKLDLSSITASKYKFNIDLPALFSKLPQKEFHINLIPNLASLLQAKVTVGSDAFRTGFAYDVKLRMSTAIDLRLEKKTNSLKINYNLPVDKFRVFELETKQWWIEETPNSQRKVEFWPMEQAEPHVVNECTSENDSYYFRLLSPHRFGLKYCSTISLPRRFALNSTNIWLQGPILIKISSEKLDDMKGFSLEIKTNFMDREETSFSIIFDAPGAKTNRKIELVGKFLDSAIPTFNVRVAYPSQNSPFDLTVKIHDTLSERGFSGSVSHGQAIKTNYQCVLSLQRKDNQVLYQPICYSQRQQDRRDYIEGSLTRGNKEINVDLVLTSPITNRPIILKGLIEHPSSILGGFHFKLTNGEIVYNNPLTANDLVYSLHALVDGEIIQTPSRASFDLDLKYGRHKPETDVILKSVINYVPSHKFGLETIAMSNALRRFNVNFKFLAEMNRVLGEESIISVWCFLDNFWNLTATRKAGNDSGRLDLTLDIQPLKRRVSLQTKRVHVDSESLTKFDFESTLKWKKMSVLENSNSKKNSKMTEEHWDEDKIIFLKLNFKRNESDSLTNGSYLITSKQEVKIMGKKHEVDFMTTFPKSFSSGVYNFTAKYVSPTNKLYGITLENIIVKDLNEYFSDVSSNVEIQLLVPALHPIFVKWRKIYYSVNTPSGNHKILTDFSVMLGEDIMTNFTFFSLLTNQNDIERVYQSSVQLEGLAIPAEMELEVQHFARLLNKKLVSSTSQANLPFWGSGKWTLEFVDNSYALSLNLTPTPSQGHHQWPSINFSMDFGGLVTHFQDFVIKSKGSLHVSNWMRGSSKSWGWVKLIEANETVTRASIDFSTDSVTTSELRFKVGIEETVAIFDLSLGLKKDFIIAVAARTDIERPYDLLTLSTSIGNPNYKMWIITFKQENDGLDVYTHSITIQLPGVSVHFVNIFENSPLKKSLNSNIIMLVDGMEELARSLSVSVDRVDTVDPVWNLEFVNSENDQTQLKCFGTFTSASPTSWNGTLEAVRFYGKSGTLLVFLDIGDVEKLLYISGNLDGKRQDLLQFKLKTLKNLKKNQIVYEGSLNYPSYSEYRNSYAFGPFPGINFRLDQNSLTTKMNGEDGLEFKVFVRKQENSPTSIVKTDLTLKWTDLEKRAFFQYNYGSYDDLIQTGLSWSNSKEEQEEQVQKLKILLVHGDYEEQVDADGDTLYVSVNVTSGLQWIKKVQENVNLVTMHESKSLCVVTEKIIHSTNGPFDLCTLGYSSSRNASGRTEKDQQSTLDLKFAILDKIAFQGVRMKKFGSLTFSSSFWLDSVDKPEEELKFSILKVTQEDNLGSQHSFTVKHPFLPRDLQVKLELEYYQGNKFANGILEIDIFEEELDKVFLIARVLPSQPEDDMDDDFGDYGNSESEQRATEKKNPEKFECSIQSDGLRVLFKIEGSMDSISGTSYSFLDRNRVLQEGKFILKFPSLFDPNIFQIGQDPIISLAFRGVPRLEINPLKISNNSLIFEYHGSPHSIRFFVSREQIQKLLNNANDYDDSETSDDDPDNFLFYAVTIPKLTEEHVSIEFLKQSPKITQSLLNISISLNTSKLLRIENKWNSNEIKITLAEFDKMKVDWLRDLKFHAVSSTKELSQNVINVSTSIVNALPSFQRLFNKLENEFQENLEKIQQDPQSNIVYEFCSGRMLELYQLIKLTMSEIGRKSVDTWQMVNNFVMGKDWDEEIRQFIISSQEKVRATSVLALGKVKEYYVGILQEITRRFHLYSKTNAEFKQIVDFIQSKQILYSQYRTWQSDFFV